MFLSSGKCVCRNNTSLVSVPFIVLSWASPSFWLVCSPHSDIQPIFHGPYAPVRTPVTLHEELSRVAVLVAKSRADLLFVGMPSISWSRWMKRSLGVLLSLWIGHLFERQGECQHHLNFQLGWNEGTIRLFRIVYKKEQWIGNTHRQLKSLQVVQDMILQLRFIAVISVDVIPRGSLVRVGILPKRPKLWGIAQVGELRSNSPGKILQGCVVPKVCEISNSLSGGYLLTFSNTEVQHPIARFMAWNPLRGIEKRGKQRGKRCTVSHTAEAFRGPGSEGLRLSFFLESKSIPWALNVKSQMNTREQEKMLELKKDR